MLTAKSWKFNCALIICQVIFLGIALLGEARAKDRIVVDLELVLLADASGSIDQAEIQFQRRGYVAAINHPKVLNAIADGLHGAVALTYVEWGDAGSQDIVVPWRIVKDKKSAMAFSIALFAAPRRAYGLMPLAQR